MAKRTNGKAAKGTKRMTKAQKARLERKALNWIAGLTAACTVVVSGCMNVQAIGVLGIPVCLFPVLMTALAHGMAGTWKWVMYCLAGITLFISIPHLAHGFEKIGMTWESWPMSIIFDLTQIACKVYLIESWRKA